MSTLTAIDLFAGAGGLSLAARNSGIRVLAAIENSKHACSTYRKNFIDGKWKKKRPRLYEEDILSVDPRKVMAELELRTEELDVLMGGPPCQGYSSHRIKNAGVEDPRNSLLIRYFAFVRALKPKVFLVENVPGLLWERHKKHLTSFKRETTRSGYALFGPQSLNARDYGVPQNRKRVFMVGVRNDLEATFAWPEATHLAAGSEKVKLNGHKPWVPAKIVFKDVSRDDDPNDIHMNHSPELVRVFESTPANGGSRRDSCRTLPCHENHNGHKDPYGRIDPSKPGPTMTTACINPSKGRFVHPTLHHGITLRQAARFQGFPDTFDFEGGLMAGGVQAGNAVPIPLGQAILHSIKETLLEES